MYKVATLPALLALVGCAQMPASPDLAPTVVEVTQYVAYECGAPPSVDHVELLDVEFRIIPFEGDTLFTLTAPMYENLGKNTSSILAGLKQVTAQRNFYRECIDSSKEALTNDSD